MMEAFKIIPIIIFNIDTIVGEGVHEEKSMEIQPCVVGLVWLCPEVEEWRGERLAPRGP
jgi:hypothetical protein